MISRQAFVCFLVLLAFSLVSCGGGSSDINTVKNGTLFFDQGLTVGNALEGYSQFTKKEWKIIPDPQKRKIVEFDGTINLPAIVETHGKFAEKYSGSKSDYDKFSKIMNSTKECQYYARFIISTDGKHFAYDVSGIKFTLKDGQSWSGNHSPEMGTICLLEFIRMTNLPLILNYNGKRPIP